MNKVVELTAIELDHVAGGEGYTIVADGAGGSYIDNGSSCSVPSGSGSSDGGTPALNANLGIRG